MKGLVTHFQDWDPLLLFGSSVTSIQTQKCRLSKTNHLTLSTK